MASAIRDAILILLGRHEQISGTEELMFEVNVSRKSYLIKSVRLLEDDGQITIIPSSGGRGRKSVYKRNPNQPGLPRKVR